MNFSSENKFFRAITFVGDFIFLNILFVLFSIPIVTIGASYTALYTVIKSRLKDEESYVFKDFLTSFKSNFKNSTLIWTLVLITLIPLYLISSYFVNNMDNLIVIALYMFVLICFLFTLIYVFPLQATFINTPLNIIKNSFLTSLNHLPMTILLCITTYTPIAITLLSPKYIYFSFPYWLLIGFSIMCLCSILVTNQIFNEYIEKG